MDQESWGPGGGWVGMVEILIVFKLCNFKNKDNRFAKNNIYNKKMRLR